MRRIELHPDQLQELDVAAFRHPVQLVQLQLGQPGEQLEQRDSRVALVEVCPLRRVARDPLAREAEEILKGAGVEDRRFERHRQRPSTPSLMKNG